MSAMTPTTLRDLMAVAETIAAGTQVHLPVETQLRACALAAVHTRDLLARLYTGVPGSSADARAVLS